MDDDPNEISMEPVIGHYVGAREKPQSALSQQLDDIAKELDITRRERSPKIEIVQGDVGWDGSKRMTLRLDTLREIVDHFDNEE